MFFAWRLQFPASVNEEFIAFNKAIDEEVIVARAQLKLDMIRLRKELDEQEKRDIAAAKQRYLDELTAKKESGNIGVMYVDVTNKSLQRNEGLLTHWLL